MGGLAAGGGQVNGITVAPGHSPEQKRAIFEFVVSLDGLLRAVGVDHITWTLRDGSYGIHFPADCNPEARKVDDQLRIAQEVLKEEGVSSLPTDELARLILARMDEDRGG